MSDDHLKSDEEKAEELKAWWKEHGNSILGGVALAIAVLFGWDYWKGHQQETAEQASNLYTEIQKDESGTVSDDKLKRLQDDYSGTAYATFASLDNARGHAESGNYAEAIKALQWAVDNAPSEALAAVAKLRLARVQLANGQADEALAVISDELPSAYDALAAELKGDIFVAKNDLVKAREAYDKAISTAQSGAELIKLKRDNLGEG